MGHDEQGTGGWNDPHLSAATAANLRPLVQRRPGARPAPRVE
ncbi:hypothetical protein PCLA_02r0368 [Pseudomonas citronellolis]|nr:hypothetical protein PCLA_02r0368 [Pseudomonas citronellolis]